MKKLFGINSLITILIIGASASIALKYLNGFFTKDQKEQEVVYNVRYDFEFIGNDSISQSIKAFIPVSGERQHISSRKMSKAIIKDASHRNQLITWSVDPSEKKRRVDYSFQVRGNAKSFSIDPNISYESVKDEHTLFTEPSEFIESEDVRIVNLAKHLKGNKQQLLEIIEAVFTYVKEVPSEQINELMTATEVLDRNAASCNGKSRLFVALCRSLGIPARVTGGLILESTRKKTSHLWAEIAVNNTWIPFDALNNHFAHIPANYLTIYRGDEFLVTHSANMRFDYFYEIEEIDVNKGFLGSFNMWHISKETGLPTRLLSILLLLPVGALVVAIFRNVIGMKTFGVFLPVLIAISFVTTGFMVGVLSFLVMIGVISLLHIPLSRWGVLHIPKLVVMLIAMIFAIIVVLYLGVEMNIETIGTLTIFPVVIMTVTAEKYARFVVEEGFEMASKVMIQTLIVTIFTYYILRSPAINTYLMNYPELLLVFAAIALLLGKWIGLRISEYKRFGWLIG